MIPPNKGPEDPVTVAILDDPAVTRDVDGDTLVLALKNQLLVRRSARTAALDQELRQVAEPVASLNEQADVELSDEIQVEVWRLKPAYNSIDEARRLSGFAQPRPPVATGKGPALEVPAVSPNHVCVVSSYNSCPAGPPIPTPPPPDDDEFVMPLETSRRPVTVVIIDTGYIPDQQHPLLDGRVKREQGYFVDTVGPGAVWQECNPDSVPPEEPGIELSEVTGHGTFIAGIVAHLCPHAAIRSVGERREVVQLPQNPDPSAQGALYADEFSVANMLLRYRTGADVMSCGFAFPTLDAHPSIAFSTVMQVLNPPVNPSPPIVVVSPAGNESSNREYWPAAHPDVIGVAATNRMANARAWFSNWGSWVKCCTRGQDVHSTYIHWRGPVQGEPDGPHRFVGWARWDGTSFAGPKVAAAIACELAKSEPGMSPLTVYEDLVGRATVRLTDPTLAPGVSIPYLKLG